MTRRSPRSAAAASTVAPGRHRQVAAAQAPGGWHALMAGRYRARVLLIAGLEAAGFGIAILQAVVIGNPVAGWLPQADRHITSVPDLGWGVIWLTAGVLIAGLCWWRPADRYLFALAVFLHTGWTVAWIIHFLRHGQQGDWGPALAFATIAAGLALISGWPDP